MLRKLVSRYCWMRTGKKTLTKGCQQLRLQSSVVNSSTWEVVSSIPDIAVPTVPLHNYMWRNLDKVSHLTALECMESHVSFTYGELRNICGRVASSLKALLQPNEQVGIVLPNTHQLVIAFLACSEAGIPVSFYNPTYTIDELTFQLDRVQPNLIICDSSNLEKVRDTCQRTKMKYKIMCTKSNDGKYLKTKGVELFEDLYKSDVMSDEVNIDMNKISMIYFSGGTTGLPKPVGHTHKSFTMILKQLAHEKISPIQASEGNNQDTVPVVLPMFHMYANGVVAAAGLVQGAKLTLLPNFSYEGFLRTLRYSNPTVLYFVPPLIFMTGTSGDISSDDLKQVRAIVTAAAPCSLADMKQLQRKAPIPITQMYGCSEAGIVTGTEVNVDCEGSVGSVFPNCRIKVLDVNSKEPLPPNKEGELVYTGPQISQGYLNNPEATAEMFDSEGWVHSGDIGFYNEEGKFFVTDRIKDVMKVKGYQVTPSELEGVLRQCPGVLEAGVVGIPDSKSGETPVAVISVDKANPPTIAQLENFTGQRLAPYKKISKFIVVDEVPKTMAGKILRREIRKMLSESK